MDKKKKFLIFYIVLFIFVELVTIITLDYGRGMVADLLLSGICLAIGYGLAVSNYE